MGMKIHERFEVQAAPDEVWEYLIDPSRVVQCLPGAELLEAEDDRTFTGRVRVKVGPVSAAFRGRARFEELDPGERRVRMVGEGQESSGSGSASMTMTSRVTALPGGGSSVEVDAEVEIVGRLVQFGRGMIEEVSRQMFVQFSGCVRDRLEAAGADAATPPGGSAPGASGPGASRPAGAAEGGGDQARQPLRIVPLVWAALVARIRRLFGGERTQ